MRGFELVIHKHMCLHEGTLRYGSDTSAGHLECSSLILSHYVGMVVVVGDEICFNASEEVVVRETERGIGK